MRRVDLGERISAYALTRPGAVTGVLNFSGFVVDDALVPVTEATVTGTPFFWAHGIQDPAIPFTLAQRGRSRLDTVGAELEARDYPIGHWIDGQELSDAATWLDLARTGSLKG